MFSLILEKTGTRIRVFFKLSSRAGSVAVFCKAMALLPTLIQTLYRLDLKASCYQEHCMLYAHRYVKHANIGRMNKLTDSLEQQVTQTVLTIKKTVKGS